MLFKTFLLHLPSAFLARDFLLCTLGDVCHPLPCYYLSALFICTLHLLHFHLHTAFATLSCPQTTAIFTINIKVSDDVLECYVEEQHLS